jgi:hypothetical protein
MLAVGLVALVLSGQIAYTNGAGDVLTASATGAGSTTLVRSDAASGYASLVISPDG